MINGQEEFFSWNVLANIANVKHVFIEIKIFLLNVWSLRMKTISTNTLMLKIFHMTLNLTKKLNLRRLPQMGK
jgi:hypothetical protein